MESEAKKPDPQQTTPFQRGLLWVLGSFLFVGGYLVIQDIEVRRAAIEEQRRALEWKMAQDVEARVAAQRKAAGEAEAQRMLEKERSLQATLESLLPLAEMSSVQAKMAGIEGMPLERAWEGLPGASPAPPTQNPVVAEHPSNP